MRARDCRVVGWRCKVSNRQPQTVIYLHSDLPTSRLSETTFSYPCKPSIQAYSIWK